MATIDIRVNIRYTSGAKGAGYDEEIDLTSDGRNGTLPRLVDSPITYKFDSAFRPWSRSKSAASFGSVKVYGQEWLEDVNQLTEYPPKIRIYVSLNGATEELVYDGKSYQSKRLGDNVREIVLAPFTEILNESIIDVMVTGVNPSEEIIPPHCIGRQVYQMEPVMYDYSTNKYLVCTKENNSTYYGALAVYDNGDPLSSGTDYTASTDTIDGNDYYMITLTSPAVGKIVVDMTFDDSTTKQIVDSAGLMMDYKGVDNDSITDNATAYYSGKYGQNIAQHGWIDYGNNTIRSVMDIMANSVCSCWHSTNGLDYYLDPLKVPEDETATLIINGDDLRGKITSDIDTAPNLSLRIGSRVNHYPYREGEVASGASAYYKNLVSKDARVNVSLENAVSAHSCPTDNFETTGATHYSKQFKTKFLSSFTAANNNKPKAQVAHLANLYGDKTRRFYTCTVTMNFLEVTLGEIAELNGDGISGKNVQVVGISGDLRANEIKLILWG